MGAMLLVDTITCWTAVAHLETECPHTRLLDRQVEAPEWKDAAYLGSLCDAGL